MQVKCADQAGEAATFGRKLADAGVNIRGLLEVSICQGEVILECFFVHVRTLIEFLGIRPPDPRDRSARDTFTNTNWPPTFDAAQRARLDADWEMVSQHLVHFSKARVVHETGRVVVPSTDRSSLERIANDVLEVWDQYATASNTLLVPHRASGAAG